MAEEEKPIKEVLQSPALLADRVYKLVSVSQIYEPECSKIGVQVQQISVYLRDAAGLIDSGTSDYDRPLRRVLFDVSRTLERAHALVRRCHHGAPAGLLQRCQNRSGGIGAGVLLRQVFSITSAADLRKLSILLDSSIADMKWLLGTVYGDGGGTTMSPIAASDPILCIIWPAIASLQPRRPLGKRAAAAVELERLAKDNDQYAEKIVAEEGIPPLLRLLKEGWSDDSQIAAANALYSLGANRDGVLCIVREQGIPSIVKVLGDSSTKVQIAVANLVSKMAEIETSVKKGFEEESAIKPFLTPLSVGMGSESTPNSLTRLSGELKGKEQHNRHCQTSYSLPLAKKEWEKRAAEPEELKLELRRSCAQALWRLSEGNSNNCKTIADANGLSSLARLIASEDEKLQISSLWTVAAIAAEAEIDGNFKRSAFKMSSGQGRMVFYQLLRVIQQETRRDLRIPAIRAAGCLARIFSAKETRMIQSLVPVLGDADEGVAMEATIALRRFAAPRNTNRKEHSKAIIEFDGIRHLMMRLHNNNNNKQSALYMHALTLLCYLALNVESSPAFQQAPALEVLVEVADGRLQRQYPSDLRDLVTDAIRHLTPYRAGTHLIGQTEIRVEQAQEQVPQAHGFENVRR